MRFKLLCGCASALCLAALLFLAFHPPLAHAQWGEPEYFAIRGARVFPVSGPPIDGATVVVSKGIIAAIGKDAAIPPEAWVIDGKGLNVYPGLVDAFTDVGIPAAPPAGGEGAGPGRPQERANGREDRPASTPCRSGPEASGLTNNRHATW